ELVKEQKLTIQPVIGLKAMDDKVSNLTNQRQIVTWAFNKDSKVNDIKRFDIENGYVVVKLDAKHKKGLNLGNAKAGIRTKLLNEKKGKLIKEKMKGDNLQEIATVFNAKVQSSRAVSLGSPILPGIGRSEGIISTLIGLQENQLYKGIDAASGVIAVKITKKDSPKGLDNYNSSKTTVWNLNKSKSSKVFNALKKLVEIEDNRATFY
ncbi:MAG TPA: peptidylprolyl isomerase, partial [Flavobacteriaceae bacterium]|nr:peptidylprolyl isomerase [Flavobacteriaceae bacterium]